MKEGTEITTHAYGLTRTFADILIALDHDRHYTSPKDAISDLFFQLRRFRGQDSEVAYLSVKILMNVINDPKIFTSKSVAPVQYTSFDNTVSSQSPDSDSKADTSKILNIDYLRSKIFDAEQFETEYKRAFDNHCREKLANLVSYLNEFRRYSSADEIRYDLFHRIPCLRFTPCGPASDIYYFDTEGAGWGYPFSFFTTSIENNWDEITTDGALDADKLHAMMFDHHSNSINTLGLDATIAKDYISDSPCYPEVFHPKKFGTGPVYVKGSTNIYIRSCGEGIGPNSIPDCLEYQIARLILEEDENYIKVHDYFIPKEDMSLPVYNWEGKIAFKSPEEKLDFIRKIQNKC